MTPFRATRILLSLPLVLATVACAGLGTGRPDEVTAQEYAVYRAVLDGTVLPAASERLVVRDTAGIPEDTIERRYADRMLRTGVPEAVARDFRARNLSPATLRAGAFGTRLPVRLIAREGVDSLFRPGAGNGWGIFYGIHHGSSGLIRLSRVGFSADGSEAVVMVDHSCGFLCGTGHIVFLRRREGRWEVVDTGIRWRS